MQYLKHTHTHAHALYGCTCCYIFGSTNVGGCFTSSTSKVRSFSEGEVILASPHKGLFEG